MGAHRVLAKTKNSRIKISLSKKNWKYYINMSELFFNLPRCCHYYSKYLGSAKNQGLHTLLKLNILLIVNNKKRRNVNWALPLESEYLVNFLAVNPELSAKVPPKRKRIGPQCHHGQNGPIRSFQQDIAPEMRKQHFLLTFQCPVRLNLRKPLNVGFYIFCP